MGEDPALERLAGQLEGISEELGDLALAVLRQAADLEGDTGEALVLERRIARARRAVDKAAALLARGDGDTDPEA